jgi:hypothetical protein
VQGPGAIAAREVAAEIGRRGPVRKREGNRVVLRPIGSHWQAVRKAGCRQCNRKGDKKKRPVE